MSQLLAPLFLSPLSRLMWRPIRALTAKSGALASSNYLHSFISWRALVLLVLLFPLVMLHLFFGLPVPIFLYNMLPGGKQLRYRTALLDGLRSLRKLASPRGLLFSFYLVVLTPLTGVGFYISLTKKLCTLNFISEVVNTTPLYFSLYLLLMAVLSRLDYRMLSFLHAAVLESRTPDAAFRRFSELVTSNRFCTVKELLLLLLFLAFIRLLVQGLFKLLPALALITQEGKLLQGTATLTTGVGLLLSAESRVELLYRLAAAFAVLLGNYLLSVVPLLCSSFFLFYFTKLFLIPAREQAPEEQPLLKSPCSIFLLTAMGGSLFFVVLLSLMLSFLYAPLFARKQHTKLIVHRTGGYLASENSVTGIIAAENMDAYGSEIDVQCTLDSYYVTNYDDNFERLVGVN